MNSDPIYAPTSCSRDKAMTTTQRSWIRKPRLWFLGSLLLVTPFFVSACGGSKTSTPTTRAKVSAPPTAPDLGSSSLTRLTLGAILDCQSASSKLRDLVSAPTYSYETVRQICDFAYNQLTIDINLGSNNSSVKKFRFELAKWIDSLETAAGPYRLAPFDQMTPAEFERIVARFID